MKQVVHVVALARALLGGVKSVSTPLEPLLACLLATLRALQLRLQRSVTLLANLLATLRALQLRLQRPCILSRNVGIPIATGLPQITVIPIATGLPTYTGIPIATGPPPEHSHPDRHGQYHPHEHPDRHGPGQQHTEIQNSQSRNNRNGKLRKEWQKPHGIRSLQD